MIFLQKKNWFNIAIIKILEKCLCYLKKCLSLKNLERGNYHKKGHICPQCTQIKLGYVEFKKMIIGSNKQATTEEYLMNINLNNVSIEFCKI